MQSEAEAATESHDPKDAMQGKRKFRHAFGMPEILRIARARVSDLSAEISLLIPE
jgi:hypothetical protein